MPQPRACLSATNTEAQLKHRVDAQPFFRVRHGQACTGLLSRPRRHASWSRPQHVTDILSALVRKKEAVPQTRWLATRQRARGAPSFAPTSADRMAVAGMRSENDCKGLESVEVASQAHVRLPPCWSCLQSLRHADTGRRARIHEHLRCGDHMPLSPPVAALGAHTLTGLKLGLLLLADVAEAKVLLSAAASEVRIWAPLTWPPRRPRASGRHRPGRPWAWPR
jgi:hypothetical protein